MNSEDNRIARGAVEKPVEGRPWKTLRVFHFPTTTINHDDDGTLNNAGHSSEARQTETTGVQEPVFSSSQWS